MKVSFINLKLITYILYILITSLFHDKMRWVHDKSDTEFHQTSMIVLLKQAIRFHYI